MENETYTIELADGTCLIGLAMNGNNYISDHIIDDEVLTGDNLIGVSINGEVHEQMVLDGKTDIRKDGTEQTWFILRDISEQELKDAEVAAKFDFLAMEVGVEL